MTVYSLEWRRYRRSFRQPLRTHHGDWAVREGLVVRLQDQSQKVGWGEIAPIPWFGSETIDQAIEFCESLAGQVTEAQIAEIPDRLSACQFGLGSALEMVQLGAIASSLRSNLPCSVLLSIEGVLRANKELQQSGTTCVRPLNPPQVGDFEFGGGLDSERLGRLGSLQNWGARGAIEQVTNSSRNPFESWKSQQTFKCKISVQEIDREIAQLDRLLDLLPPSAKLRLDANGGLSEPEAYRWLEWCDRRSPNQPQIEFIEQPLPPDYPAGGTASYRFLQMQQLSQQFQTPIALDESVATIEQLQDCYQQGWQGIFVIKPAIAGSPARLRQFCKEVQPDVVWSSALETAIGRRYIEDFLIPATGLTKRAIGFGIDQWFADNWGNREADSLWHELAEVGS